MIEIPKQLIAATFRQVLFLDLSKNLLTLLTESLILSYPSLHTLILSGNKISFISPEIKKLRMLRVLRLNSNMLTMIPNEVGEILALEEINL